VSTVDLSPADCLEAVDFVARQAHHYGIALPVELRRSRNGDLGRHYVMCRRGGPPTWVMHLVLADRGWQRTALALGLARYRRNRSGVVDGAVASAFVDAVCQALAEATGPRQPIADNVVALHRFGLVRGLSA